MFHLFAMLLRPEHHPQTVEAVADRTFEIKPDAHGTAERLGAGAGAATGCLEEPPYTASLRTTLRACPSHLAARGLVC